MKKISLSCVMFLFAAAFLGTAHAQESYPSKPIKIIIPLGPGSGNDVVTRILSESLEKELNTRIEVDYKAGGGGGVIGADFLANSKPDGYTLGTMNSSIFTNAPVFNPVPFDPIKGFTAIARLGAGSIVLVVNATAPWKSVEEFLDHAKTDPGKATCGTTGVATVGNLDLELLKTAAGVQITHVPYKAGSGPNIAAVLGGHIDCAMQLWPVLVNHVRGGKLRALATVSRIEGIPPGSNFHPERIPFGGSGSLVRIFWTGQPARKRDGKTGSSLRKSAQGSGERGEVGEDRMERAVRRAGRPVRTDQTGIEYGARSGEEGRDQDQLKIPE